MNGGLGVGLTLARRLVDMHSGILVAVSDGPGRGSEFRLSLPRAATTSTQSVAQAAESVAQPSAALRVLVVDDHVDATRALRRLLQVMGHQVTVAHDGKSGIELAEQMQPDVILLDIGLPRMDGYTVARHLRTLPAFAATRIIALTGYGATEARENARKAGFDLHLVKPVDAEELEAAICAPR